MAIFSDTLIRSAKPKAAAYKLPREGGLFMIVNPNGSKWWRLSYSFAGREKLLSLGKYPDVPLKAARARREDARRLLAAGVDPSQSRRDEKSKRAAQAVSTFKAMANEWLRMKADSIAPVTFVKARWMLETFAFPELGAMSLTSIQAPDVLRALRPVERSGKLETMHRTKARISEVFRYAIATGRATSDPCRDLRGALKPKKPTRHHPALTEPQDVGRLLRAIDGYRGAPETCAALRLSPLVFVRPGELRAAQWPQFDLDGPAPSWRYVVPKTKCAHIVPLADQAVKILREVYAFTGRGIPTKPDAPRYVFPNVRSRDCPMSENAITAALRGMGYTGDQMTGHGFRATARTLLSELGWRTDAIERQLAHKASGPLGAAYDRAQFLDERRRMMQAWADYLDELRNAPGCIELARAA